MPKKYLYLRNISFTAVLILLFALSAFAQNRELQSDLNDSFVKYDLIRIDNQTASRNARNGQTLSIAASGKNYELVLTPRDLRSPRYKAEDTTASGVREMERGAVTTYKGKISGEENSQVRLTINETKIEGYFNTNGERFFIEPARKYSRFAAADELVVYREKDFLKDAGFLCDSGLAEKIEQGKEMVAASAVQTLRVIEIATEADFQYVTTLSGAAQANGEILSILNMTEGTFESEIGLTLSVVYQHTWTTADPFSGGDRSGLLASFQSYWNTYYPASQLRRDTAHLFSGKAPVLSGGQAFIGVICNNPAYAYGMSGYIDWAPAKFLITAHELGHNLGAQHAEAAQSCADTLMNAQLSGATALSFCAYSRAQATSFITANGSCLSNFAQTRFDFDGDAKADLSIFRPSLGEWWYLRSSDSQNRAFQFGVSSDKIVPADYTGDGKTDVAVFRSTGEWFILRSEDSSYYSFPFGTSGDVPAPADFDGDDKTDAAVFRPSIATWFVLRSSGGVTIQQFGAGGDAPVAADYDADGQADIAIYRPSNGEWWIQRSAAGTIAFQFGNSADRPVAADYTGDGKTDVAVFRPATGEWFVLRSENFSYYSAPFGISTDIPAPGDFDGDGRADFAIFRPSEGNWYINQSSGGNAIRQFGLNGDKPAPAAFIP